MSSKGSELKPIECEDVTKKSKRKGKILNQGLHQRSKISALRHGQTRALQGLFSGGYRNLLSGLWTYYSKCTNDEVSNQLDVTTFSFINLLNQPYMFRTTDSPILRSNFWLYIQLLVQCTDTAADRCTVEMER